MSTQLLLWLVSEFDWRVGNLALSREELCTNKTWKKIKDLKKERLANPSYREWKCPVELSALYRPRTTENKIKFFFFSCWSAEKVFCYWQTFRLHLHSRFLQLWAKQKKKAKKKINRQSTQHCRKRNIWQICSPEHFETSLRYRSYAERLFNRFSFVFRLLFSFFFRVSCDTSHMTVK